MRPSSRGTQPAVPGGIAVRWQRFRSQGAWRRVSGKAGYALGDQVVFSFGNMVVAALISRHCALAAFGVYILTQRVMDVLIQLSNGLLWTPFTFGLPGLSNCERRAYTGSVLVAQVILCALFSGLLFLLSRGLEGAGHLGLDATFRALVLTSGGLLFREFTRRLYFAAMRLREAFWTDVATVVLQIAGVWWLYRTGRLDVLRTLEMLSLAALVVSGWWLARDWREWRLDRVDSIARLRRDLETGRWLLASNLLALVSAQCNPWVLNGLMGSSAVGTYSISESLVNIPRAALTSMQNVMAPMVAHAHHEGGTGGVARVVRHLDRVILLAAALFFVSVLAGGPMAARFIYGYAPVGTRWLAGLLAVNLAVFAGTLAMSYGLTALGGAKRVLYGNLAGAGVQILCCVPMVRRMQVPGAAIALLLGNCVLLGCRQGFFARATTDTAPSLEGAVVESIAV